MAVPLALAVLALGLSGCGKSEPSGPSFGFNEAWPLHLDEVALSAAGGADTDRLVLAWNRVETHRGRFDWRGPDRAYRTMLAHGVRPLFVVTSAPCWAQSYIGVCLGAGPPSFSPGAAQIDDFADFVAGAARRYPRAEGLEIWNEPNLPKFWRPRPDPELYGRLLRAAADAVHASGSSVPVVSGGLSPVARTNGGKIDYASFLRRMNAAGGIGAADAIGFHPYPPHDQPIATDAAVGDVDALVSRARGTLAGVGEAEKPIWVTETGVSTSGPAAFTPAEQASVLGQIYDHLAATANVPVVIFHRFLDQPLGPRDWESGAGVVSTRAAPKPAYCALAQARGVSC
jgi:polysaccharide biosynthesis protein PslG